MSSHEEFRYIKLASNESVSHAVLYLWIEQNWRWGVVSGVLSNNNDDDDFNHENDDDDKYSNFNVCNKNNEALIWSWQFLETNFPQFITNACYIFWKLNTFIYKGWIQSSGNTAVTWRMCVGWHYCRLYLIAEVQLK